MSGEAETASIASCVIEPRKEVGEAQAVRNAEGNIGRKADSTGVTEQSARATGIPGNWEISPAPTSGGTA